MLRLSFVASFLLSLAVLPAARTRAQAEEPAPVSASELSAPTPVVTSPAPAPVAPLQFEDFAAPTTAPAPPVTAPSAPPLAPALPLAPPSRATVLAPPDGMVSARRVNDYTLELENIDGRLKALHAARPSLAGPITLLALGGGVALGSFELLLFGLAADGDGFNARDGYDRTMLVGMLGGFAASLCGMVWLIDRLHERQTFAPEVRALKQRRRQLRNALDFSLRADRQQQVLYLQAGF